MPMIIAHFISSSLKLQYFVVVVVVIAIENKQDKMYSKMICRDRDKYMGEEKERKTTTKTTTTSQMKYITL